MTAGEGRASEARVRVWVNGRPVEALTAELSEDLGRVDVTPLCEPDPGWEATDRAGHYHAMSRRKPYYPTLEGRHECVGHDRGPACEEDEAEHRSVYRCRVCGEEVAPATRVGTWRRYAPGMLTWRLTLELARRPAWGGPVSVRVAVGGDRGEAFGVAELAEVRLRDDVAGQEEWVAELVGLGPLGRRGGGRP